jgi:dienelactone hydrolase
MKTSAACLLAVIVVGASCTSLSNRYRATDAITIARDTPYIDDGNDRHRMHVFRPPGEGPFPTMVFVHGGWWHTQDRSYYESVVGLYTNVGLALADAGIASAVISYRYHPEVTIEGMMDDVAAAVREVRAHAREWHLDGDRMYVGGHSAGANIVTTLVHKPGELSKRGLEGVVRGVVALGGPYDIPRSASSALVNNPEHAVHAGVFPQPYEQWSLLSWLRPDGVPTLFMVGDSDYPGIAADFADVKRAIGTNSVHTFLTLPVDHANTVIWIGTDKDELTPHVAAFINAESRGRCSSNCSASELHLTAEAELFQNATNLQRPGHGVGHAGRLQQ